MLHPAGGDHGVRVLSWLLTGADLRPDTRDDTRFSGGWDGQYVLTENGRFTGFADFAYANPWSDLGYRRHVPHGGWRGGVAAGAVF